MSKGLERGGAYHLLAPSLRDHRTSAVHPATSSGRTGAGWNLLYNGPFMLSLSKHEPHQPHARQNLLCTRNEVRRLLVTSDLGSSVSIPRMNEKSLEK